MTSWQAPVGSGMRAVERTRSSRLIIAGAVALAVFGLASSGVSPASAGAGVGESQAVHVSPLAASAAGSAVVANDYASIFQRQAPELVNSGWNSCAGPITWSIDSRQLTPAQASAQVGNARWALEQWAKASGLSFAFAGEVPVNYNDKTFQLTPADGSPVAVRHVYLTFLGRGESKLLSASTLGFGAPSTVAVASREITGGNAVFRTDYVQDPGRNPIRKLRSLYLHELGHVLGLSHAALTENIMYPIVDRNVTLGAGDVRGIHVMTKPCGA
jgi:hypothetical protein